MDNVEMYNCSQIDTMKAAIRFEGVTTLSSSVSNSTFHNGLGWGASLVNSANIFMQDNIWFNFRPLGVVMDSVRNITFDNNVIAHVIARTTFEGLDKSLDKKAGVAVCSYRETKCSDLSITNNLVAGAEYAGFIVPGHTCGDTNQKVFRDNIAHSIFGTFKTEGWGALIYANKGFPSSSECIEGSYFTGYKCHQ